MEQSGVNLTYKEKAKFDLRKQIILFVLITLCFWIYRTYFKKEAPLKGIYTIGTFITLDDKNVKIPGMQYQLGANVYTGKLTKDALNKVRNSSQFIIILLDGDPVQPIIIGPVPNCLIKSQIPLNGWKELPTCK